MLVEPEIEPSRDDVLDAALPCRIRCADPELHAVRDKPRERTVVVEEAPHPVAPGIGIVVHDPVRHPLRVRLRSAARLPSREIWPVAEVILDQCLHEHKVRIQGNGILGKDAGVLRRRSPRGQAEVGRILPRQRLVALGNAVRELDAVAPDEGVADKDAVHRRRDSVVAKADAVVESEGQGVDGVYPPGAWYQLVHTRDHPVTEICIVVIDDPLEGIAGPVAGKAQAGLADQESQRQAHDQQSPIGDIRVHGGRYIRAAARSTLRVRHAASPSPSQIHTTMA